MDLIICSREEQIPHPSLRRISGDSEAPNKQWKHMMSSNIEVVSI